MTRKTIAFQAPANSPPASPAVKRAARPRTVAAVDDWVHQSERDVKTASALVDEPLEQVRPMMTIKVSPEPDPFEVMKICFILPGLALSFWTLCAAQRCLQQIDRRFEAWR